MTDSIDLPIIGRRPVFPGPVHVGRPNLPNRRRLYELIDQALDRCWLTNNGPLLRRFEEELAALLKVRHVIALCNGTLGIEIAAKAVGMKGEVIVPAFTFVATAHALQWVGLRPMLCDVDPDTHNLNPDQVAELITPRTGGIVGVHIWGRPCAIDELTRLAASHSIPIIFDAAHALACSYRGGMIGNFGDAEVFSFHATKFLNTFEGGAIATNNDNVAERARLMRNFGFAGVDDVVSIGTNGKLTEIGAAMGLASLEEIDHIIAHNRGNYDRYRRNLSGVPGLGVLEYDHAECSNYQYVVVEVDNDEALTTRDDLIQALWAENVLARRYFYPGLHNVAPYSRAGSHFPVTDSIASRVMTLPSGTAVGPDEIDLICALLRSKVSADSAGTMVYSGAP